MFITLHYTMTDTKEDFLDNDTAILGQNYVCLSFVSPEKFLQQKEMYMFHKYMLDKFREYNELITVLSKKHLKMDEDALDNISEEDMTNDVNKNSLGNLENEPNWNLITITNNFKRIITISYIDRGIAIRFHLTRKTTIKHQCGP